MSADENMVINRVDDNDTPLGTIARGSVFAAHANFRVVHIFVFNHRGDLLLQQVGFSRTRHPGYWGSSVAGYVAAGEAYEAAAYRRTSQELGLSHCRLTSVGKTEMSDEGCKKFIELFTTVADGPFEFDRDHIAKLEFQSLERILQMYRSGARRFTPTFLHVLRFYDQTRRVA